MIVSCRPTFAAILSDRWQIVGGSVDHADAAAGAVARPNHRLFPQVYPLLWRPQGWPPGLASHLQHSPSHQMTKVYPVAAITYDSSHFHCASAALEPSLCSLPPAAANLITGGHKLACALRLNMLGDGVMLVWPEGRAPSNYAAQQAAQQLP